MAAKIAEKKIEEADAAMKEADKITTKTLFRWKPNWEEASGLYERAGTCYKNAKTYGQAKDAYKKASKAFYEMDIVLGAARNMDLAASMAKEEREDEEASDLYVKAADLYIESGDQTEKAAECFVKAAKMVEATDPTKSFEIARKACDVFEANEREQFAASTFRYVVALLLKTQKFDEVVEILDRQTRAHEKLGQLHDVHKMHLSVIIIHLKRDDYVAADKAYKEFINTEDFATSTEGRVAAEILDAYETHNNEMLQNALKKQVLTFLDQEVVRTAKTLKIAEGGPGGEEQESLA